MKKDEKKTKAQLIDELVEFVKNWEENNPTESFNQLIDRISLEPGPREAGQADPTPVYLVTMHNAKGLEFPTVIITGINPTYMPFFMAKGDAEKEEERRLFYVAATRAIKQLVISLGSRKRSPFLSSINLSLYSIAYSIDDILGPQVPRMQKNRLRGIMAESSRNVEEKYLEHPIFGRGKVIEIIGENKFIVEFVNKGQKTIDASIVPVTFL